MLSRFSVKKPYTVVVAVVLVILLGVVSVTKMNTDLLPSMNLPYAIVMTTYVGASPESVEETVTKPIEQSMATVSNIKNVSSVSRENVSMVILEFEETTNMDSVSLEMRENLDQIKGYWDDSVSNPIIMKLNPDMLPVLVAAVDVDDMTAAELTDYIEDNVQPNIESIDGVARVSQSGSVTENIEVRINQEKLDAMNRKVQDAINGKFAEEEEKLDDAQAEIDSGKSELDSGQSELESGQNEAASQIGEGSGQLSQAQSELTKSAAEVDMQLQNLESKQTELDSQSKLLQATEEGLNLTVEKLTEAKNKLLEAQEGMQKLEEGIATIQGQIEELEEQLNALTPEKPDNMTDEEWQQTIAQLTAAKEEMEGKKAEMEQQLAALNEQFAQLDPMEVVDKGLEAANSGLQEIAGAKAQLAEGQTQLNAGIQKLQEAKAQIEAGQSQMSAAQIQLETQKIMASIQLSSASSKIAMGTAQLEAAQSQLDSGRDQLNEAKEQAQDKADLNTILTSDMVKGILTAENFAMPAGYVTEDNKEYLIRVGDKVQDVDSLGDLVLLDLKLDGLASIRLSDVADISVTDDSAEVYAKINGNPGMILSIEKQTGYSTGDVADKILDRMEELEKGNDGLHFTTLMNQGIYIDMVVNSVLQNMLYGGILAILVLFLFLRDIKPTFVIACSIPISVVAALVLMYFSGVTLNIISLSGLALGVGMLVDNSIVVIENIYRMRSQGIPARKAAVEGAKQVAGAIVSSTLTTVCVFAPIVFTEGITRQLFVDMGLTIGYSLAASLVVALTLVPMMSAGLLKRAEAKPSKLLDKVQDFYGRMIHKTLKHKAWVLLGALVLFLGSMYLSVKKGTEFFPSMESTQASLTVTTDKGTPLKDTAAKADEIIDKISDIDDIETIGAMAGGSSMSMGSSTNEVTMYLVLKEDKKLNNEQLEKEILKRTKGVDGCEVAVSTSNMDMSALGGSGLQVEIKGKDLEQLQEIATDLAGKIEKVKGTQNVYDGMEETDAQYKVVVDKSKAMRYGLTVAQVFQEINKKIAEATSATTISTATKDYDVYVRSEKDESLTREQLADISIQTTNAEGETEEIKVGDIATFEDSVSPQAINRDSQSRYMSVTAEIASGYNIGLVSQDVQKILDKYNVPEGYTIEMKGEDESINEAMGQLLQMLALALVFMYLIMVAQFQSLLSPFIIMFTIPLAFTGGFMGLLVSNKPVSIVAMVGFVMLSGIIVNNGIVLVDYINQLRKDGMEKRAAIEEAGRARLRPIVMTALTTILGLLTMAMGMGMGADMVQPMAIVTIGGLIYGTLLTLFVVPCIYDILNRRHYKKDEERLVDEGEAQ
ncbi:MULTISPECIES: efflux RND transporter permease subunit [Blautia]|uniref:efflux RND transporter permease subunit n=1 Tax=Blautia TaxID=572511 RepID=UPI000BA48D97|nr:MULTISPECIES: efflux RND transporter permease subunit [Blautia]